MSRIIVVEDNSSYAEDIADFLGGIGHEVRTAASAGELWSYLGEGPADIVLLDLGLPDADGFEQIPRLRQRHSGIGILVLTARAASDSRIQGLRLGADGYLCKPIKFPELAAHVEALGRRIQAAGDQDTPSPWSIRRHERRLELRGRGMVELSEKEFQFLHLLARNRQSVPRSALLIGLGEADDPDAADRINMLVYRLRKKVKNGLGEELPLRAAYGGGYSLVTALDMN